MENTTLAYPMEIRKVNLAQYRNCELHTVNKDFTESAERSSSELPNYYRADHET